MRKYAAQRQRIAARLQALWFSHDQGSSGRGQLFGERPGRRPISEFKVDPFRGL
jgi:hypothetical protein